MDGFCLLVELLLEGSASAACVAGLFLAFFLDKSIKLITRTTALKYYCWKFNLFKICNRICALNQKMLLLATKIILVLVPKTKYQTRLDERFKPKWHLKYSQSFSSPEYSYTNVEHVFRDECHIFGSMCQVSHVTCHISHVICQVSHVTWKYKKLIQFKFKILKEKFSTKFTKEVELVGGGSVINGT